MSMLRRFLAGHRRAGVRLHLGELEAILSAGLEANPRTGLFRVRADPDLASACRRIERARDKRLRAVERAQGAGH